VDNVNVIRTGFFAPDFSLPDTLGEVFTLSENISDNLAVICFFSSNPDDTVKGYLRELDGGLPRTASGVESKMVGIIPGKIVTAAKLKDELKLNFPVLSDQKLTVARRYYVVDSASFETSVYFSIFVVDSEGVIRYRVSEQAGYSEYDFAKLKSAISTIL